MFGVPPSGGLRHRRHRQSALPQCPEMSGFVRSFRPFPRSHPQPPVPTELTAIYIAQPTGHTGHPPRSRSSSRSLRALRALRLVCLALKAASSVFSAFSQNVRKCPVLSGLLNVTYPLHKSLNTVTIDTYHSFPLQIVACTLKCNN